MVCICSSRSWLFFQQHFFHTTNFLAQFISHWKKFTTIINIFTNNWYRSHWLGTGLVYLISRSFSFVHIFKTNWIKQSTIKILKTKKRDLMRQWYIFKKINSSLLQNGEDFSFNPPLFFQKSFIWDLEIWKERVIGNWNFFSFSIYFPNSCEIPLYDIIEHAVFLLETTKKKEEKAKKQCPTTGWQESQL